MNIRIINFYYLIAGVLAILFAFTHAWNGQSSVLPTLNIETISVGTQTIFTYVWHIITVENLVFGIVFIFMSFLTDQSKFRFTAWFIVSILIVRLMAILSVTAFINVSGLKDAIIDSIAIVIYVALIILGTRLKKSS